MKKIIPSVKGTRDFYPENMSVRNWLQNTLRQVSESFGYQEYDGPFLETLELYAAKSGEELVKEQSYVFQDRGGDMITLRPELTLSLVRMIAQRQGLLTFPLRWWSFGPFWRYERPQKGRTREFFQWNVDLVGVDSPESDAEMVAVIATFFRQVGLPPDKVMVLINNRRLMDAQLSALSIQQAQRPQVSTWIDRREKLSPVDWESFGLELGLYKSQVDGIKGLLDDTTLWQRSDELKRTFEALAALGVSDYVRYDASIVRGLLYYTGTVIEAKEIAGDLRRSILGGGRYDNLMADVGGDPLPGVGFAMGDVVISLVLEKYGLLPAGLSAPAAPVLVTIFDAEHLSTSFAVASELRQAGIKVACYPEVVKLPRQFKYADRLGMRLVIVIGPDEAASNCVTVKDLQKGIQQTVERKDAPQTIYNMLAPNPPS